MTNSPESKLMEVFDALANGNIGHLYRGTCPDPSQPDSRDNACLACRQIDAARAAIVAYTAASPSPPSEQDGLPPLPKPPSPDEVFGVPELPIPVNLGDCTNPNLSPRPEPRYSTKQMFAYARSAAAGLYTAEQMRAYALATRPAAPDGEVTGFAIRHVDGLFRNAPNVEVFSITRSMLTVLRDAARLAPVALTENERWALERLQHCSDPDAVALVCAALRRFTTNKDSPAVRESKDSSEPKGNDRG
jgi:hypothetical protein